MRKKNKIPLAHLLDGTKPAAQCIYCKVSARSPAIAEDNPGNWKLLCPTNEPEGKNQSAQKIQNSKKNPDKKWLE